MPDTLTIQKVNTFTGHTSAVYTLESAGSNHFYSGSGNHMIALWELDKPDEGVLLSKLPETVYSLLYIKEQNLLLAGQAAGGIHVIDTVQKKELRLLQYHNASVFQLTASYVHNCIFSLSGDGILGIMSLEDLSLTRVVNNGGGKLRSIAFTNDHSLCAVGAGDGSVTVYSLPEMKILHKIQAHPEGFSVNALRFLNQDSILLSGSRDAHLNLFDVKNNFHPVTKIPAHNYAVYSIAVSPDGKLLATASRDKTIKIWDAESMEFIQRIDLEKYDGHRNSVNKVLWHETSGLLVSASDDRSIIAWKIGNQ